MKPADNQKNFKNCVCPGCSLYIDCNSGKNEKLFCAREISECAMDPDKICICAGCPVYAENSLSGGYFCLNKLED